MAVSKRLRFEIMRRDENACKKCGRTPPEVRLNVDHVIPVALGGSDEPNNLQTLCHDCNIGKSSSAPDSETVEAVAADAERWAAAMQQAANEAIGESTDRDELYEIVRDCFPQYYWDRIPSHYKADIDAIYDAGLPPELMAELACYAARKRGVYKRWAYFCGCCWTRIREIQERAAQIIEEAEGEG